MLDVVDVGDPRHPLDLLNPLVSETPGLGLLVNGEIDVGGEPGDKTRVLVVFFW